MTIVAIRDSSRPTVDSNGLLQSVDEGVKEPYTVVWPREGARSIQVEETEGERKRRLPGDLGVVTERETTPNR